MVLGARRAGAMSDCVPGFRKRLSILLTDRIGGAPDRATVLSDDPLATSPPGRPANAQTVPVCPAASVRTSRPLATSHTRTVLSDDPLATSPPGSPANAKT